MLIATDGSADIIIVFFRQISWRGSRLEPSHEQIGRAVFAHRRAVEFPYERHSGSTGVQSQRTRFAIDVRHLRDIATLGGRDVKVRIGWRVIRFQFANGEAENPRSVA